MLNIKRFNEQDYQDYFDVVDYVNANYEVTNGDYYTFEFKDVERVLYKYEDIYTVFYYDKNRDIVDYNMFSYSPEEKLATVALENGVLYFKSNGEILEDKTGIIHSIVLLSTGKGNMGNVLYTQYNPHTDVNAIQFYEHHYMNTNERQFIYEMRLKSPVKVVFRKHAKSRKDKAYTPFNSKIYARVDHGDNKESPMCSIALIKEYGLVNFLNNGPYNLIKGRDFSRYYRILRFNSKGELIYLPIVGNQYKQEDINQMLIKGGFRTDVPKELLTVYNRGNEELTYFLDLAQELEELEISEEKADEDVKSYKM